MSSGGPYHDAIRFRLTLGPWEAKKISSATHVPLEIKPGETVKLDLGKEGRTVVGKVALPEGFDRKMHWDWGINYLVALRDGISAPEEVKGLGFDWRKGWSPAWSGTREGRAYAQTLHQYSVRLNPDGAFRISGVPDGEYALLLNIYDPPPGMG